MSKPTVKRKDISLFEERDVYLTLVEGVTTRWTALIEGRLSTGEHLNMERSAERAGDALLRLIEAIEGNGWEVE